MTDLQKKSGHPKQSVGEPSIAVVMDADQQNWVYRVAPVSLQGYLKLARLDRPVGVWLLLWPCWWSVMLAPSLDLGFDLHNGSFPIILLLFAVGALAMRGAGCTYNDIVDRDFDVQVARTARRPIPAGEVSPKAAVAFLVFQGLIGLAVLLNFNTFSIGLGIASLALVLAYPFMKRITWWPQVWLGLTFNWGALMGWAVVEGKLALAPVLLYIGALFWTLGYDTIYAHQDREDDALIGVKSTARRLGEATKRWLVAFYGIFAILITASAWTSLPNLWFLVPFVVAFWGLFKQIRRLDIHDSDRCLALFKANIGIGGLVFAGLALSRLVALL